jgi:long-chain acyl-CoA synthetase
MSTLPYLLPHQMLAKQAQLMPDTVYLRQPVDRVYRDFSWSEVHDSALRLAASFYQLGLMAGDTVSILSKNTAEWLISDFAISMAGMVSAPIYVTAGEETIRHVIEHSEARAIIVGKLDDIAPAAAALTNSGLITIAMPYETLPCDHQMSQLIADTAPLENVAEQDLADVFSLVYTSGSTGKPKAAIVSFANIAYNATAVVALSETTGSDRLLSYLPLAHIAERAVIEHASLYSGASVSFVESLDTFAEDLRNTEPTFFFSVPRLWMKFQMGVLAKMPQHKLDVLLRIPIVRSMVKKKIKKQLGLSKANAVGSGTAPMSLATLQWFAALGIEISEGWGMTETGGLTISHHPFVKEKLGTIGRPLPGSTVKVSDQGEILVQSDGVIKAYYKDPEKTAEALRDGWLHTGDKGEIDAEGYVRITGRVKDIFKSAKGKYVVPVPIESLLFESTLIEQACVMGVGLAQPVAAVVLAEDIIAGMDRQQIEKSLTATLVAANQRLEGHEKLSHVVVCSAPWSIENGLLTPTLKIKRSQIEQQYHQAVSVASSHSVVWQ